MSARRIKVLLVSPLPPPVGGITTWSKLMLRTPVDPDIDRTHVDVSVGPRGRRPGLSFRIRQLLRSAGICWRIIADRPDVVHLTSSYKLGWMRDAIFLAVARRRGARTIVNLRGGDFEAWYAALPPGRRRTVLEQLAKCDAVVPITEETTRYVRGLGLRNVTLIPNCIDVRAPTARNGWPSPVRWLFVGHVTAQKGIAELLAALRRFPNARLTIVGPTYIAGGEYGERVFDDAARDPALGARLTHMNDVAPDDARAVYPHHDIFVFPTRNEGFPNAVLEAMEAAMPIVATRVGAIPDMIVDGEHGLLVDDGDQEGLERAIERIMSDPQWAATLGSAARARAAAMYDVRLVMSIWCRLYRDVVKRADASLGD